MRPFKEFILEMFIALFVIVGILIGLFAGDFFDISIRRHFISFVACLSLLVVMVLIFVPCISRGILAFIDVLFSSAIRVNGKIVNCMPMNSSMFLDRWQSDGSISSGIRYCYIVKMKKSEPYSRITLISSSYIDYDTEKTYYIRYGKLSKILISISETE